VIEVDMRVKAHGHGETEKKHPWFTVTFVGKTDAVLEASEFKLTVKSEKASLFDVYPLGKVVSLKLHDPQRKLSEASE